MSTKEKSANSPEKNKGGRPPKLVADEKTITTISGLARIQCTNKEAAAVLGVARETFEQFLGREEKALAAWEHGKESGRASLRRSQFRMAESNATMAIWLGKQYLEQKDQRQVEVGAPGDFDKMDKNELREFIRRETSDLGLGHRSAQSLGGSGKARSELN